MDLFIRAYLEYDYLIFLCLDIYSKDWNEDLIKREKRNEKKTLTIAAQNDNSKIIIPTYYNFYKIHRIIIQFLRLCVLININKK